MKTTEFEDLAKSRTIHASVLFRETADWLGETYKEEELEKRMVQLKALCRKLPSMLHDSGLVTTLLYLSKKKESKDEEADDNVESMKLKLADGMIDWLKSYRSMWDGDEIDNFLLYLLDKSSLKEMLILTKEGMNYAYWLKRSAENDS